MHSIIYIYICIYVCIYIYLYIKSFRKSIILIYFVSDSTERVYFLGLDVPLGQGFIHEMLPDA